MNRQIKILLAVFVICLLAVVLNLTWIQIFGAEGLQENPYNTRRRVEEYETERGEMISADREVLARSVDTGEEYRYQREYPLGELFANVTGYDSWRYGKTGLEKTFNRELLGEGSRLTVQSIKNKLLGVSNKGNSLLLTVDSRLQNTAAQALGERKGAVVAIDPRSGRVLSMATSPTFDPNVFVPMKGSDAQQQVDRLVADPDAPLLDRCTNGLYPPGSSFKVVVAAAALDQGIVTESTRFDCDGRYEVYGYTIHDFGNQSHGQLDFARALVVSCNVTFARVGVELGAPALVRYAELFGFNQEVPFDLPVAESTIQPAAAMDPVAVASSSIGQAEVLATCLEMSLVASCVANGGEMMRPYLVDEIQDYNGKIIRRFAPERWKVAVDRESADTLTEMMVEVVDEGTGTAARIRGVPVAGKTGTAEVAGADPHAWFICFAPADEPEVAVAVVVENGGLGGSTAAPIAREVLQEALSLD